MTLQEEYFQAKGMVGEVIMKCKLAESKMLKFTEDSIVDIVDYVDQLNKDFDRYSKEMNRIKIKMEIANDNYKLSSMAGDQKRFEKS